MDNLYVLSGVTRKITIIRKTVYLVFSRAESPLKGGSQCSSKKEKVLSFTIGWSLGSFSTNMNLSGISLLRSLIDLLAEIRFSFKLENHSPRLETVVENLAKQASTSWAEKSRLKCNSQTPFFTWTCHVIRHWIHRQPAAVGFFKIETPIRCTIKPILDGAIFCNNGRRPDDYHW